MGDLRRRPWFIRRYGPGLTMIFLAGVWPRAGIASGPPSQAAPPDVEANSVEVPIDGITQAADGVKHNGVKEAKNEPQESPPAANTKPSREVETDQTLSDDDWYRIGVELDRAAAATHALDQLLPRKRELDRLLKLARDDLAAENYERAVEALQDVLDTPDDSFTRYDDSRLNFAEAEGLTAHESEPNQLIDLMSYESQGTPGDIPPESIRQAAANALRQFPDALALYRRMTQPSAASLLSDARRGESNAARDLLRRYRLSHEATEFSLNRAAILVDAGAFDRAQTVLRDVAGKTGLTETELLRIGALQRQISGSYALRSQKTAFIGDARISVRDQRTSVTPQVSIHKSWSVPSGAVNGNAAFSEIGPVLSPAWSVSYGQETDSNERVGDNTEVSAGHVESAIQRWQAEQSEHLSDAGPAGPQSSVIANDRVIARDFHGLFARRLADGQLLWRDASSGSLAAILESAEEAAERGLIERRLVIDSVSGELTADEDHVYWVEHVPNSDNLPTSQLVATRLTDGQRVWTHVLENSDDAPDSFVLGPPTPTRDGLMLVVEVHGRLELQALNPSTGKELWTQSIAMADVPAARDRLRLHMSCRPISARGIVVCGTQMGAIVAVDSLTGTLRWVQEYASLTSGRGGRPRSVASREFNSHAFPNAPIISDGIVYTMPIQSADVLALSLETGAVLWEAARENDNTIACVDEPRGQIILHGDRFVRALGLVNGTEIWRVRTPQILGRGVGVGNELLLPIASRELLRVNLETQQVCDARWNRAAEPASVSSQVVAGNLALVEGWVVRSGPTSLSVMPRSERVREVALRQLASVDGDARVNAELTLARVDLASEDAASALQRLAKLESVELNGTLLAEYEHLFRETLFASLPIEFNDPFAANIALERLSELARTPSQNARVLRHRVQSAVQWGDARKAVQSARQLVALTNANRPGYLERHNHRTSVQQLGHALLSQLSRDDVRDLKLSERAMELAKPQAEASKRAEFLTLFGRRPEAGVVRVAVAEQLVASGQPQKAEFAYLLAIRDGETSARMKARIALAGLYARHDMPREAAAQWEALLAESKDRFIGRGMTVSDLVAAIPAEHPVGIALRQRQPFPRPAYAASIRVTSHPAAEWADWYSRVEAKMSPHVGSGIDVLDSGRVSSSPPMSRLLLINQAAPTCLASIDVPSYYAHPPSRVHTRVGQVMPIAYFEPFAVSLLEGRKLWSLGQDAASDPTEPSAGNRAISTRSRLKYHVGVATPEVTVMQQHHRLVGLNTMTGEVLWSRNDLDRRSGLRFDQSNGVFGDADRTTVFDPDGIGFQTFETSTGNRLSRGRIEPRSVSVKRFRFSAGRRMLYLARANDVISYRSWDSANPESSPTIELKAGPVLLHCSLENDRVAVIDRDDVLNIVDLKAGRVELRTNLPDVQWDHATELHAFEQNGIVFVDIEHSSSSVDSQYALPSTSVRVPSHEIGGSMTAIRPDESGGGEVLWTKQLGRGTVLSGPEYRLPVLLVAAKVRRLHGGQDRISLRILRTETGEELAHHDDIPRMPICRWTYDVEHRRVELQSPDTTITVRMGGLADVAKAAATESFESAPIDPLVVFAKNETVFVSVER